MRWTTSVVPVVVFALAGGIGACSDDAAESGVTDRLVTPGVRGADADWDDRDGASVGNG